MRVYAVNLVMEKDVTDCMYTIRLPSNTHPTNYVYRPSFCLSDKYFEMYFHLIFIFFYIVCS